MTLKKREQHKNPWHKGRLCCVSVIWNKKGWDRTPKASPCPFFTLRKVRQSPLLPCIFCLPSEAFWGNMWLFWLYTSTENRVSFCYYESIRFYSAHRLPLCWEHTTKRRVGQKLSEYEPLCHYSDKKRQSLVSNVSSLLLHLAAWNTSLSCMAQTQTFAQSWERKIK